MNIAEFCVKNGRVETLKKLCLPELAIKVADFEKYKEVVTRTEGVVPFDDRPAETRRKLSEGQQVSIKADDVIWKNRKKEVG